MKTLLMAGALALAAISLSACNTVGLGLPGTATAGTQLTSTLDTVNSAVANNCQVDAHLTLAPPLPPMGSANISCSPRGQTSAPPK